MLIVLLVAGVRLWRSPYRASDLVVVPDSGEYAIGAQRFATRRRYDIEIEGVAYPPRYPPWFPVAVLAPAYWIAPDEIGAGIVPVFLIALSGVWAAFRVGRRLGGDLGGAAAAAVLAGEVNFGLMSREIMTDAPAAVLTLWLCDLYLGWKERPPSKAHAWPAGVLGACAAALRVETAPSILPFVLGAVREREGRARKLAGLVVPFLVLAAASAIYQQAAFGDWRRNGYGFWCPVPHDYLGLSLSTKYLSTNLRTLAQASFIVPMILGIAGAAILLARGSRPARGLLWFTALGALPGALLHLIYFSAQIRFQLPLLALASVVGGAGLASLVPEAWRARRWIPAATALVPLALPRLPDPEPQRRVVAETLAASTPDDAVIITAIDAVYLEPFVLRGTHRRIVPVSRKVEYASKCIAPKRVDPLDPPARGPFDHRTPGLFRGGAKDVCAFSATEKPELLAEWVRQGIPVYADFSYMPYQFPLERMQALGIGFQQEPGRQWLARLVAKP